MVKQQLTKLLAEEALKKKVNKHDGGGGQLENLYDSFE